jgi:hypothetical protein
MGLFFCSFGPLLGDKNLTGSAKIRYNAILQRFIPKGGFYL